VSAVPLPGRTVHMSSSLIFSKKTQKSPDKMGSVDKEATTEHKNNVIDSQKTMYSPKK
jgi:hypothetical protein